MYQSILAAVKPAATQHYVIAPAAAMAKQLGAKLALVTVIDEFQISPLEPLPVGGSAFKVERDAMRIQAARSTADRILQTGRDAADAADLAFYAECLEGDAVDLITRRAREHDLLVVGDAAADGDGNESLLARILKKAGRPVMVLPKQPSLGDDVVAAYDDSLQASRALASFAYSGLGIGRTIHVVVCDRDSQAAETKARTACRFLQHHGLSAEPHLKNTAGSQAEAEAVAAAVREFSAGLVVMGAFGNSAMREFLLGSTTQTILRCLPAPVFIDR